jgi:hypothetical protein
VLLIVLGSLCGGGAAHRFLAPPPEIPASRLCPDLDRRAQELRRSVAALRPRGPYLVVDVRNNRFALHRADGTLLRAGRCSTGKAKKLQAPDGREWEFTTPRGFRRVLGKSENPVWKKPDWVYVENGESIPPADAAERFEVGALGEYALGLGQGYYVHGTPYTLGIGRSITHGCVRLLDDDLRLVYETLREGDAVFLF